MDEENKNWPYCGACGSHFVIHNRENFTFIQTKGCVVRASANNDYEACNAAARAKIAQIFDKGITFWVDNANVGNYKVRNKPLE